LTRWKLFKFAVENCFKNLTAKEWAKFEIMQFSSEIFSKTLPAIFLYFSPFVGRIVVSKI